MWWWWAKYIWKIWRKQFQIGTQCTQSELCSPSSCFLADSSFKRDSSTCCSIWWLTCKPNNSFLCISWSLLTSCNSDSLISTNSSESQEMLNKLTTISSLNAFLKTIFKQNICFQYLTIYCKPTVDKICW